MLQSLKDKKDAAVNSVKEAYEDPSVVKYKVKDTAQGFSKWVKSGKDAMLGRPVLPATAKLVLVEKSCRERVRAIIKECKASGKKFVDEEWSGATMLWENPAKPLPDSVIEHPTHFVRLSDMSPPKSSLFRGGIDPGDVQQGGIGTCFFLGAVSVVGTRKGLLNDLFVEYDQDYGVYGVRFFLNGDWTYVVIDDFLPAKKRTKGPGYYPIYSECKDPRELWVPLLEKAYAKAYSCYQHLDGGVGRFAMMDLTGGIPSRIELSEDAMQQVRVMSLWCTGMDASPDSTHGGRLQASMPGFSIKAVSNRDRTSFPSAGDLEAKARSLDEEAVKMDEEIATMIETRAGRRAQYIKDQSARQTAMGITEAGEAAKVAESPDGSYSSRYRSPEQMGQSFDATEDMNESFATMRASGLRQEAGVHRSRAEGGNRVFTSNARGGVDAGLATWWPVNSDTIIGVFCYVAFQEKWMMRGGGEDKLRRTSPEGEEQVVSMQFLIEGTFTRENTFEFKKLYDQEAGVASAVYKGTFSLEKPNRSVMVLKGEYEFKWTDTGKESGGQDHLGTFEYQTMYTTDTLPHEPLWELLVRRSKSTTESTIFSIAIEDPEAAPEEPGPRGLLKNHAYGLLTLFNGSTMLKERLVKIRNPHGHGEWTGDWGDKSPLWTRQAKLGVTGYKDADDGCFWMSEKDFISNFTCVDMCRLLSPAFSMSTFTASFEAGGLCGGIESWWENPQFILTLTQPSELMIVLQQPNSKIFTGEDEYPIGFGIQIVQSPDLTASRIVAPKARQVIASECVYDRQMAVTVNLSPSELTTFHIIPYTSVPDISMPFDITVYSSGKFSMSYLDDDSLCSGCGKDMVTGWRCDECFECSMCEKCYYQTATSSMPKALKALGHRWKHKCSRILRGHVRCDECKNLLNGYAKFDLEDEVHYCQACMREKELDARSGRFVTIAHNYTCMTCSVTAPQGEAEVCSLCNNFSRCNKCANTFAERTTTHQGHSFEAYPTIDEEILSMFISEVTEELVAEHTSVPVPSEMYTGEETAPQEISTAELAEAMALPIDDSDAQDNEAGDDNDKDSGGEDNEKSNIIDLHRHAARVFEKIRKVEVDFASWFMLERPDVEEQLLYADCCEGTDWMPRRDQSKRLYYHNKADGRAQWQAPEDVTHAVQKSLEGDSEDGNNGKEEAELMEEEEEILEESGGVFQFKIRGRIVKSRGRVMKARGRMVKARGRKTKARGRKTKARGRIMKARGRQQKARGRAAKVRGAQTKVRLSARKTDIPAADFKVAEDVDAFPYGDSQAIVSAEVDTRVDAGASNYKNDNTPEKQFTDDELALRHPALKKKEVKKILTNFRKSDRDGSGNISSGELQDVMKASGITVTADRVGSLLQEMDRDHSGTVSADEMLSCVEKVKAGDGSKDMQKTVKSSMCSLI